MYADDIKVYGIYNQNTKVLVHQALAQSITNMMDWAKTWDIPVSLDKTVVLHIGKPDNPEYYYNGTALKVVKEVRDLGILINDDLDAKLHINRTVQKAFATVFMIFRNFEGTDPIIYLKLYKAYVIPVLEYGSQI
ncbi:unnamed protein product [Heligmosomoides polygyrus]|uniref:Reverse transcriptase domain-containing protein n=1 Tax=Heligmosomoides polygyrus TaxID=6339 RepID=A0A183G180_HELPZ|nr:unnamed protein product [Heligmosomoides polygyrus]